MRTKEIIRAELNEAKHTMWETGDCLEIACDLEQPDAKQWKRRYNAAAKRYEALLLEFREICTGRVV